MACSAAVNQLSAEAIVNPANGVNNINVVISMAKARIGWRMPGVAKRK